jgi:hypothetical protein
MTEATPIAEVSGKPPLRYRRLRIAMSVFFAVLTVALCVQWVRSYGVRKIRQGPIGKHVLSIQSAQGELGIGFWDWPYKTFAWNMRTNADTESLWPTVKGESPFSNLGIRWYRQSIPDMTLVVVPFWLPVSMAATIAVAPWIIHLRRFSLRTMLIATTLVAVVLGLGVWLAS